MAKIYEDKYKSVGVDISKDDSTAQEMLAEVQALVGSEKGTKDYEDTWSNYTNLETFLKFLGQTSYYLGLQKNLCKIISIIKPSRILELGFGTGHTAFRVAKENPNIKIQALDWRQKMVEIATDLSEKLQINNVDFCKGDMKKRVKENLTEFDFIYLLYNFHHIEDSSMPNTKRDDIKTEFLRDCFYHMKPNSYLCIAELFLPAENDKRLLDNLFESRVKEGHASTFWNDLKSLDKEAIRSAKETAQFCEGREENVGIKVANRNHEYLVTKNWLENQARRLGFIKIIDEDINTVGDAIMLFKKE